VSNKNIINHDIVMIVPVAVTLTLKIVFKKIFASNPFSKRVTQWLYKNISSGFLGNISSGT